MIITQEIFLKYMRAKYPDTIEFNPQLIQVKDGLVSFGMKKHMGRLQFPSIKILEFMSLKMPIDQLDIQMLSMKLRRFEAVFKEDPSQITEVRLSNCRWIRNRIIELKNEKDNQ